VCSNSNPPPVANFEANPTSICAGNSVQFTNLSTNATSYNWTFTGGNPSSSTNANPVVIYTNPGNYSVTLIATGPGGSNTMTKTNYITVNPKPNISIYATRDSICKGDTTIIFATGGDSYLWSHNLGSQPMVTIMPEISTTYFATATNSFNCSNVDSISIIVNQPPNISINAQPSTICQGDTAIITATGAHNYYWSSNANNDIISVSPNNSTSYIVTGYSNDGCSSSVSVAIIVKPIPPKPIIIITNNSPFTLMSTSDIGNQWYLNDNPISGATEQTYIVNENGNYFTIVTIDGCSSLPSNLITINNVGINDYTNDEILIYPNPAQDIIYIQSSKPINEVMIINNLGQIVATYSDTGIINIDQLANGVYQIMIKTENNIKVLPLIKIK
jgi:PKD repeat protein